MDDLLPVSRMYDAAETLGAAGIPVRWHVSRGLGHGIDPEGLDLGGQFLKDAFDASI
jgi:phospholipase/carboxylesterase